jgi:hypothetical protein
MCKMPIFNLKLYTVGYVNFFHYAPLFLHQFQVLVHVFKQALIAYATELLTSYGPEELSLLHVSTTTVTTELDFCTEVWIQL